MVTAMCPSQAFLDMRPRGQPRGVVSKCVLERTLIS